MAARRHIHTIKNRQKYKGKSVTVTDNSKAHMVHSCNSSELVQTTNSNPLIFRLLLTPVHDKPICRHSDNE